MTMVKDDPYGLRSSDKVRTGFVSGQTFTAKPVRYSDVDGVAMFEGDIVLGTVEEMEAAAREHDRPPGQTTAPGIGITGQQFRWPGGIVPYEIAADLPNQARVTDAIAHWQTNTRIRFVLRTAANAADHPNYVTFRPGDGCSSRVGMQGGQQFINLGVNCTAGSAIHEIGHCIGLWHEQSREDRDTFVTINWANIKPGEEHNFNQQITDGDDIGTYDFGSIMHYGTDFFSSNGLPTIVTKGGQAIGQRSALSVGDLAAVRTLYPQLEASLWSAVLMRSTVAANQTKTIFSPKWPAHWIVAFTMAPVSPLQETSPQLRWRIQAERQTNAFVKYWMVITNLTGATVEFDIRYDVTGWVS